MVLHVTYFRKSIAKIRLVIGGRPEDVQIAARTLKVLQPTATPPYLHNPRAAVAQPRTNPPFLAVMTR